MIGSVVMYSGLVVLLLGLILIIKPIRRLRFRTRRQGLAVASVGIALVAIAATLPAPESRASAPHTRLNEFSPAWQFREFHFIRIAASPEQVFEAIGQVQADEISMFRLLTWIRRGGQPLPEGVLNAGSDDPIIDVALRGGFVRLADDAPRELVIGTVVARPPGAHLKETPEVFKRELPPGFALAAMNFLVQPDVAPRHRAAGGASSLNTLLKNPIALAPGE